MLMSFLVGPTQLLSCIAVAVLAWTMAYDIVMTPHSTGGQDSMGKEAVPGRRVMRNPA